jgi:hypothetical protein
MATQLAFSKIATEGLVFLYDTFDIVNSYKGEPTTNLLPSAPINALPTYGNGWGTYNTNQYCGNNGCAVYWTIPDIASVSNNIITTVSSHQIRTYDVINPETTGGGLTAGTQYFAKKISDTQFSLHAYNGSQDGSQGYTNLATGLPLVWDSIYYDQRVSVNSSSFPTKWFGYPHQPNSGLVKEIRPNGYTNPYTLQKTDCIRLRWIRPDGVTDGMAYSVDPYVEIGVPVNVSFYTRAATLSAVGQYISFQNYNYGGPAGYGYYGMTATWGGLGEWVRNSYTFTPTHNYLISYWFPSAGNMEVDIANIQIEQKPHATPFTTGTRSSTQGLLDVSGGGSSINLANVSFDTNAQMVFDGTDDYISSDKNIVHGTNEFSYFALVKLQGKPSLGTIFENGSWTSCLLIRYQTNGIAIYSMGNYWGFFNFDPPLNTWYYLGFIRRGNTIYFYVNGVNTDSISFTANISPSANLFIGTSQHAVSQCFNGSISAASIYTRALSDEEILSNFNHCKTRFNIT